MKNSRIEWTHHTFNPWIGCTRVSPGCKHCYAEAMDHRWGHDRWGVGKPRTRTSVAYWKQPIAWNKAASAAGERHRVFCASLADVFDAEVSDVWRLELFDLIRRTPQLDWLLLTKRTENIPRLLQGAIDAFPRAGDAREETVETVQGWCDGTPPPNVWLGVTVEDQQRANKRIPELLAVPAAVHFLSCEPLLEAVYLSEWLEVWGVSDKTGKTDCTGIDWVIAGGESGRNSRPMLPEWPRWIRDQCEEAGVPFFFKQWGGFDADGKRVGKAISGRLLDGVQHDGYPTPRAA